MRHTVYKALPDALAIAVIAAIPWGERIPIALPLVIAAAISRALRPPEPSGRWRWSLLAGLVAGAVALVLAVLVAAPAITAAIAPVNWATYPIARGNPATGVLVGIIAACIAGGTELALRGWIVERARSLGAPPIAAIAAGALAEALVTPGPLLARLGAAAFGAGFGALYFAARRDLVAPIAARAAFFAGIVLLETFQLV